MLKRPKRRLLKKLRSPSSSGKRRKKSLKKAKKSRRRTAKTRRKTKRKKIKSSYNAMKLIVGLGNPGAKYKDTRHNIGAKVVRELAGGNAITLRRRKFLSHFGEGKIGDESVCVILPMTYMNLSGEAVLSAMRDKDIAPS